MMYECNECGQFLHKDDSPPSQDPRDRYGLLCEDCEDCETEVEERDYCIENPPEFTGYE